ncbi:MAG: hypothetical protein FJX56_06240, partial [Alphaproteobacteria bacterium]|nr:hypothetical protein [Alphaproteobacteria bacterium]
MEGLALRLAYCLVLFAVFWLTFAPFVRRHAQPILWLAAFTGTADALAIGLLVRPHEPLDTALLSVILLASGALLRLLFWPATTVILVSLLAANLALGWRGEGGSAFGALNGALVPAALIAVAIAGLIEAIEREAFRPAPSMGPNG